MSQVFAAYLPLPVALALGAVLLVLLAVTAVLVSLRKPARVRAPDWVHGRGIGREAGREPRPFQDEDPEPMFRLGHLRIDSLVDLSEPPRGRR